MKRLVGGDQFFVKRGKGGGLDLIVSKTTDDLLMDGTKDAVGILFGQIKLQFVGWKGNIRVHDEIQWMYDKDPTGRGGYALYARIPR